MVAAAAGLAIVAPSERADHTDHPDQWRSTLTGVHDDVATMSQAILQ